MIIVLNGPTKERYVSALGTFPAGLVIYWTWNNLLSVTQQYFIMKKNGVKVELWDNLTGLFRKRTASS